MEDNKYKNYIMSVRITMEDFEDIRHIAIDRRTTPSSLVREFIQKEIAQEKWRQEIEERIERERPIQIIIEGEDDF